MTNYSAFDDTQLLELLRDSDRNAFNEIFTRYMFVLLYWTHKRVNDIKTSEIIISDIFTDLWFNQSKFDFSNGLRAGIISAIFKNIAKNHNIESLNEKFFDSISEHLRTLEGKTQQEITNVTTKAIDKEIKEIRQSLQLQQDSVNMR